MSLSKDPEIGKATSVSSNDATAPVPIEGETQHLPTFENEKALLWKFDLRILPMLAIM
jgi:hypothetical protein